MDYKKLNFIIQNFFSNTEVLSIDKVNSGLINNTFIVEHLSDGIKSKFILQSLSNVFESHELVNINHKLITDHITERIKNSNFNFDLKRWSVPNLIRCKSNNLFVFPFESNFWRAMIYIDQTLSVEFLEDEEMAYQTGIGLAKFHLICSDLDCSKIESSVKNFHNTKYYIDKYIMILENFNFNKLNRKVDQRLQDLILCLSNHLGIAESLLISLEENSIDYNVIHGDPKLNNFLFDIKYKYVVSLIDLDTVSSGYLLTDLADCIRSICNLAGEDPKNKDNIYFDINSCKYFLKGYLSIIKSQVNYSFEFLPEFIYLIIFELTIRFLTDFLESNRYFRIKYKNHNLFRAEVQYRLLCSFLAQIPNLTHVLNEMGFPSSSTFVSNVQNFI